MMSNSGSERYSPLLLARIAGIFGLAEIVLGAFDVKWRAWTVEPHHFAK
jgi:hypothetical protein